VLLGVAIGDAMGKPFETMARKDPPLRDWRGGTFLPGTYEGLGEAGKKPGAWTDDTQMTLSLAQSIIDGKGAYDPAKAADAYLRWYRGEGPGGAPRGIGGTLRKAMVRLDLGEPWHDSGEVYKVGDPVGCGTAMRAAPLGFVGNSPGDTMHLAAQDAAITHNHPEAMAGSAAVALMVSWLRTPEGRAAPFDAVAMAIQFLEGSYRNTMVVRGLHLALMCVGRSAVHPYHAFNVLGTSGLVWDVVPSAVFAFLKAADEALSISHAPLLEAFTYAIKAGGDTDSRAAITGALLGAYRGHLLEPFSREVEDGERIVSMDKALESL
jgi:ADP-ribosylglycohydrolase